MIRIVGGWWLMQALSVNKLLGIMNQSKMSVSSLYVEGLGVLTRKPMLILAPIMKSNALKISEER